MRFWYSVFLMSGKRKRKTPKKTHPPKGIQYTQAEMNRAVWDMITVATNMMRHGEEPRTIGTAVMSNIHVVVEGSRGSVREAAAALDMASSTFLGQRNLGLADVCHYMAMHDPLDDKLFPFIRTQWQSSDLAFANEYFAWMENVVQPRAHQEQTKLVFLANFTPFTGDLTDDFIERLKTGVASSTDPNVLRGVINLAPSLPELPAKLGVVNAGTEYEQSGIIRFTTSSEAALGHAVQMFAQAGVPSIPPLHLN